MKLEEKLLISQSILASILIMILTFVEPFLLKNATIIIIIFVTNWMSYFFGELSTIQFEDEKIEKEVKEK